MTGITQETIRMIEHRLRKSDKTCPKHPESHLVYLSGIDKVTPFCEVCQHEQIQEQDRRMHENLRIQQNRGFLKRASLVDRRDVFSCSIDNFKAQDNSVEAVAKQSARLIAGAYLKYPDRKGNSLFYGNAGAGKTHLTMAILNAVNDNADPMERCLFISVNKLIREMKNWFSDKMGLWSPKHVTDIVHDANLVVLDDLGAESANNMATSFVQDTIFDIYESNQRIITTTNLSMDELYKTYHERLVSRMQEGDKSRVIDFTKIADKRSRI
ncbi:ATP-binding protein [Lactobacillus sp. ESL0236]|uniref:DnaA ATPase domain-containing protein n=1 Tax=unclassified Lactobacillus TaxID=2620435 RepID=UPI000EFC7D5D|nr:MULTISPECIES: DnaA/Hda family protein [unclassified Lactobacillus]RMC36004.1 ATP-binding protein [Lactobacillus sp. ESL0237]RMC42496.1 ATP-binding protein [Lactobacillus sp. ESL0234]RMC43495.1 ATP-binding protein [Lactobacillus sp. ESL0236]